MKEGDEWGDGMSAGFSPDSRIQLQLRGRARALGSLGEEMDFAPGVYYKLAAGDRSPAIKFSLRPNGA